MNFLADESIDRQIVERLRKEEYSVLYVVDMDPGLSNGDVFNLANQKKAILLTADKDFGEMVFHQKMINSVFPASPSPNKLIGSREPL